jgi:hypothetical protein
MAARHGLLALLTAAVAHQQRVKLKQGDEGGIPRAGFFRWMHSIITSTFLRRTAVSTPAEGAREAEAEAAARGGGKLGRRQLRSCEAVDGGGSSVTIARCAAGK